MKNNDVNKNEVKTDEHTTDLVPTTQTTQPPLYQVVVHNDDYTPMEFVVELLEKLFFMDRRRATDIMLAAHSSGKAVCGFFSRDFAEAKVSQVIDHARVKEYPLICSMEAV